MFHKKCLVLAVLLLSALLGACAHNETYRSNLSNCVSDSLDNCENYAIAHYFPNTDREFHLGFVEYDDQGQLRDREQMKAVLDTYLPISSSDDVIVTIFVHGWHHSAAPNDSNVESFKQILVQISRSETVSSQQEKRNKRKILGVYIGWRGDSLVLPLLKNTTFWERKNTAHQVGLQGVTEVLVKLEEIVNVKTAIETSDPKPLKSRMVIIGHSFGGAVVYTALQQVMADRFVDSRRYKKHQDTAKGFGDLIVLMNPAFEALRFSTLFDMSQDYCRRYWKDQLPRLVVLTSEADSATRFLFPAGRSFSVLFESHKDLNRQICTKDGKVKLIINEGEANRTTIGHFKPYRTHELTLLQDKNTRKSDFNFRSLKTAWSDQSFGSQLDFEATRLTHLNRTHPLNPYLNIYVDENLIKDHNDIWGEEIIGFIHDLIVISTTPITAMNN